MPYMVTDDCILCGVCVAGCPTGAVSEGEVKSFIDIMICIECGTCAENCPSDAIVFIEEEDWQQQERS